MFIEAVRAANMREAVREVFLASARENVAGAGLCGPAAIAAMGDRFDEFASLAIEDGYVLCKPLWRLACFRSADRFLQLCANSTEFPTPRLLLSAGRTWKPSQRRRYPLRPENCLTRVALLRRSIKLTTLRLNRLQRATTPFLCKNRCCLGLGMWENARLL